MMPENAVGLGLEAHEPLEADVAHLWMAVPDEARDPALVAAYQGLLAPHERRRHDAFAFERHRHEYLVTRALVRAVLSRYAAVAPADWTFVDGEYGKPQVAGPASAPPLRFNLSNTDGLVACVVTGDREVGVDVEAMDGRAATEDVAERFFSPAESAALRALPADARPGRFFEFWTLKEAYIKARGAGLSLPLDRFSFRLDPDTAPRIEFAPELRDDPAAWQFSQARPSPRHFLALAIRIPAGARPCRIVTRHIVPLRNPLAAP